jgi:flagellin-specific chaperone FliS
MNKNQKAVITRFLNDQDMSNTIYEVLMDSFVEEKDTNDVNVLASERIAINNLNAAWKKLERVKNSKDQERKEVAQIGL